MGKGQLLVSALLLVLFLAACAPAAAPAPAPQPSAPVAAPAPAAVPAAPAKPAWEAEWEKTVEAAKKEGRVVLSSAMGQSGARAILQGFKKAYGIPIEGVFGAAAPITQRVLSERRAGLYNYDVCMTGGTTALTVLKPAGALEPLDPALILPDVTDPELIKKIWWQGKLPWVDADHTYLAPGLRLSFSVAINPKLVKEGEIKSYRDLLDPKWRGKVIMAFPWVGGQPALFVLFATLFASSELGWDYVVEFAKTKPIILGDQRQVLDWLSHEKVAVVVAPGPEVVDFIVAGAPIKGLVLREGTWVSGGSQNLSMFNRAPHPNAAKILVNWLLTKEGQTLLARVGMAESRRLDVPTDHLLPEQVRQPGVKYFLTDDYKVILENAALQARSKELFGSLQ